MHFSVYKVGERLELKIGEGPKIGTTVAFAEQIQMIDAQVSDLRDGSVASGQVIAAWGIELIEHYPLTPKLAYALGMGRAFRGMTHPRAAFWRSGRPGERRYYLSSAAHGMLQGTVRLLHLRPEGATFCM